MVSGKWISGINADSDAARAAVTGLWGAAYAAGTSLGPLLADQFMELKVSVDDVALARNCKPVVDTLESVVPSLPCIYYDIVGTLSVPGW